MNTIGSLSFAAVPVLLSLYKLTKSKPIIQHPEKEYDFIVIGGGSAGCALASRLSEDPTVTVLLIEAGGDGMNLEARIPAAAGELQHSEYDWEDYCEKQPNRACIDIIDGKSFWPRGKCLGGSSVLNYMAYVRGNREDYDSWAEILSDPKWAWDSVKNIFKRMENCSTIQGLDSALRGMKGPLNVAVKSPINPLAQLFVRAAASLGYPVGDYNDGLCQECASILQTTTKSGARCSSADAYIWPILSERPNLHVLLKTEVARVLFDPLSPSSPPISSFLRTRGIEYLNSKTGKLEQIRCRREVILSASAVGSPKLLLQSGIGPKNELESLGVSCLLHHPEVGKNLQDHLVVAPIVNATQNPPVDIGTINQQKAKNFPNGLFAFLEWLIFGTGHLASSTYDTTLFLKSGLNSFKFPDLQLGMLTGLFPRKFWIANVRLDPTGVIPDELLQDNSQGFILLSILLHPYSRGSITLRSSNPFDKPVIHPGYFSDERDLTTLATGALKCIEIASEMGYEQNTIVHEKEIFPNGVNDLNAWKEKCRRAAATLYHPSSTCAMGKVVDSNLKVKGIHGLRVADASVFPHLTSGNTNAPAIMVGEMAADIIKQEYGLR